MGNQHKARILTYKSIEKDLKLCLKRKKETPEQTEEALKGLEALKESLERRFGNVPRNILHWLDLAVIGHEKGKLNLATSPFPNIMRVINSADGILEYGRSEHGSGGIAF